MNDKFETLNKFKGFGNPNGDYWFIGIEEALPTTTANLQQVLKNYENEILPTNIGEIKEMSDRLGSKFTKVYDIMSKIINRDNWKEYRVNIPELSVPDIPVSPVLAIRAIACTSDSANDLYQGFR